MIRFYLVLAFLGFLLPYGAFTPWLRANGLDVVLLVSDALANPISVFAWLDVLVSAVALLGFIAVDGHRYQVRFRYLAVLGTLSIGVSFGLPLYLYLKERQAAQANSQKVG